MAASSLQTRIAADLDFPETANLNELISQLLPTGLELPPGLASLSVKGGRVEFSSSPYQFQLQLFGEVDFSLGNCGSLSVKSIAVAYPPDATGKQPVIRVSGQLNLAQRFSLGGELQLFWNGKSLRMVFVPADGQGSHTVTLPLPPAGNPVVELSLGSVELTGGEVWSASAAAKARFPALGPLLTKVLPDVFSGRITVDDNGVVLLVDHLVEAKQIALPALPGPDGEVSLGSAAISIDNFSVSITDQPVVEADVALGLPGELNNVFGVSDGKARYEVFRTYDEKSPDDSKVHVHVSASESEFKFRLRDSPVKAVQAEEKDGHLWCQVDLGDYGAGEMAVPEFSYDLNAQSFMANAAYIVTKEFKLPLGLLKALLEGAGLASAANLIPKAVPLKSRSLLKDANALTDLGLPEPLTSAIAKLLDKQDQLPERFKPYLEITIPQQLSFEIAVGADTSMRFGLRVPENDPVRLLMPGMVGPMPVLNGIELRHIAIGEVLSGQLLSIDLDATFDQFDLVTLAGAMALPGPQAGLLADTRKLERSVTLKNLWTLVFYQTVIPIPVPLFHDEVSLGYHGIEDLEVRVTSRFKAPSIGIVGIAQAVAALVPFLTQKDALLPTDKAPDGLNLALELGPTYVRLPRYLGSSQLGSDKDIGKLDAYSNLAHALNFLKTLNPRDLIAALPMAVRSGSQALKVFNVDMDAASKWAVTTAAEFEASAYTQLGVNADGAGSVLKNLPLPASAGKDDTVLLASGAMQIPGAPLQCVFAVSTAGSLVIGSSLYLQGTVANMFQTVVEGHILARPDDLKALPAAPFFDLAGTASMSLAAGPMFQGALSFDNGNLRITGTSEGLSNVFPGPVGSAVSGAQLTGTLANERCLLEGQLSVDIPPNAVLTGHGQLSSENGLSIAWNFLGQDTRLKFSPSQACLKAESTIDLNLEQRVTFGQVQMNGIVLADSFTVGGALEGSAEFTMDDGPKLNIQGVFHISDPVDVKIPLPVLTAPTMPVATREQVLEIVRQQLIARTADIFGACFSSPDLWIKNLGQAITIAGSIPAAVGKGCRLWMSDGSDDVTLAEAWLLSCYQPASFEDLGVALVAGFADQHPGDFGPHMIELLQGQHHQAEQVVAALKACSTAAQVAVWMCGAYTSEDVGKALNTVFGLDHLNLGGAFFNGGVCVEWAANAIQAAFPSMAAVDKGTALGQGHIQPLPELAKYPAEQIAAVMASTFQADDSAIRSVLQGTCGVVGDAAEGVLNGIGRGAGAVGSAAGAAVGSAAGAARGAVGKLKNRL